MDFHASRGFDPRRAEGTVRALALHCKKEGCAPDFRTCISSKQRAAFSNHEHRTFGSDFAAQQHQPEVSIHSTRRLLRGRIGDTMLRRMGTDGRFLLDATKAV
jgi:hypothetical protein